MTVYNAWTKNVNDIYTTILTGNVGIGISSTTTYKLNVAGSLNATSIYINGTLINLSTYQPLLTSATALVGNGSAITNLTYANITGTPNLSTYQPLLTASTTLSGIGSNLTLVNYNTLSNLPNLSSYLTTATASTTYLALSGGTMTGDLTFNKSNLNIQLTATNGNNIGIPNAAGLFSLSANSNDMVIRSINNLMLQSGSGNSAIYIKTNNNVGIGTSSPARGPP